MRKCIKHTSGEYERAPAEGCARKKRGRGLEGVGGSIIPKEKLLSSVANYAGLSRVNSRAGARGQRRNRFRARALASPFCYLLYSSAHCAQVSRALHLPLVIQRYCLCRARDFFSSRSFATVAFFISFLELLI